MTPRPRSITVISWIFIAFGCIALVAGVLRLVEAAISQRMGELTAEQFRESGLISIVQTLAVVSGVFMLYGCNWARWLLAVWIGYHVVLSALHSPLQLFVHGLLLSVVLYFLFRPQASAYFRATRRSAV